MKESRHIHRVRDRKVECGMARVPARNDDTLARAMQALLGEIEQS